MRIRNDATSQLNTEVAHRVSLQVRLREQQAQLDHARAENADLRTRLLRALTPSPDEVATDVETVAVESDAEADDVEALSPSPDDVETDVEDDQ